MYAIYGNIYHQHTPNVSIYTIHGSYGSSLLPHFPNQLPDVDWWTVAASLPTENLVIPPANRVIEPGNLVISRPNFLDG